MADWSTEHMYDYDEFDDRDEIGSYRTGPVCRVCNKRGMQWRKTKNGKWWLWDKNRWHNCENQ